MRPTIALILALLLAALMPAPLVAAPDERCFSATGFCIAGSIRRYWEANGGLAVFGYPLTPLQRETVEGRTLEVQWFERHRLELHPELPWPATVQLGRLGVDRLLAQGRSWSPPVEAAPAPGCRFFPETGHNLCGELLALWRSAGIESDGRPGRSEAENLALFGLPLSALQEETLADGRVYQVQWFERARMELHPELPAGSRVLLGLLGSELGPLPAFTPRINLAQPVWISIPAIAMDRPIVLSGLDAQNVPEVPRHDVGWYGQSAAPGEGENIVLWGHVLRFSDAPQLPAPFAKLKELPVGSRITLTSRGGETFAYVVQQQVWARPDEVAYILPRGRELLTMVSCIGDQVIQDGEVIDMSHRLITIAAPLS
jgi:LPXTG-site transpeptidase (sortase) family protein